MTPLVQIYSNEKCLPVENIPANEHSSNFYRAVAEMEFRAGNSVFYINPKIAVISLKGDLRIVIQG
ncbi:hypothetical protein [Vibrio maritimus]|uniref:hypothetical protein n=1 Tax=Vibrio maritimus TaxID=990268 RepID=UPI001F179FEF|nr:hypothetical protein [Vibrio maritimus]